MNSLDHLTEAHYVHRKSLSRDSNQHAEALAQWDQTYDQLSAGRFEGTLVDMWFGGIQVFRETTNRSVVQHGVSWQDSYVIGIPLASKGNGQFSRQLLPPDAIFTFSSQEFSLRTPEEFDVVGIAIPRELFTEFADMHGEPDLLSALITQPGVLLPPKPKLEELRTCLHSIFDPASFEPTLLRYPQIQKTMRSAIIGHLLEVLQFASLAPKPAPSFKSRCYVVDQAVEYALAHADSPVTVADLCTQTKVSRRMLNYCFQDVLDTNPIHYLRAIRLNGVRRDLRNGDTQGNVRDIACKWGFWHLSRFAGEYRTMFGELPSDTLRTANAN